MDIFRTLGSGSLSVTAMLDFSGKENTSIYGLGEDDTTIKAAGRFGNCWLATWSGAVFWEDNNS